MYKILTLNQIAAIGLDRLPKDRYQLSTDESSPDAILVRSHKLSSDDISQSVMAIGRAGAGVNNIPVSACTERGIAVFNAPGANANAVKELVIAGLTMGSRGVLEGIRYVDTLSHMTDAAEMNTLLEKEKKQFKGNELTGKVLGVVGLGAIGSLVARAALNLGMQVVGYDPALSVAAAWRLPSQVQSMENLSSLFAKADYVSLHLPVFDSTRGLINADVLNASKPGLCLLNFARSEIVNVEDTIAALDAGKIRKFITDFPTPSLIGREDVILMPHIGASTDEAEDNCAIMAAEQVKDFLENGNITNSVNFPTVNLERSGEARIAVANKNVPKILQSILAVLADENINVADMINKSRDDVAYNLIDLAQRPSDSLLEKMRSLEGVMNVRLIA